VRGELVILPTETVYGVAADPRVAGALQRIYQAKGRPENKPIPLLGPDLSSIEEYGAELPPAARALAHRFWPGPLTLVLAAPEGEVGFRVPDHAVARALLRRAGSLLAVTSANRSGDPPAGNAQDAVAAIGNWVAVALDAGPAPGGVPSTVVRAIGGNIEILRAGAIPEQEIRAAE
jgi:L-threonylcarbamoyladenylate synthase